MKNAPIAYQIYSARKEAEQDLLSVLRQLKALGYDGVEFAGFYGHSAQDVRAMLDECGLRAVSSHVALKLIEADMQGVIDYHKAIGCDYIAVPYLSAEQRPWHARLCRRAAHDLSVWLPVPRQRHSAAVSQSRFRICILQRHVRAGFPLCRYARGCAQNRNRCGAGSSTRAKIPPLICASMLAVRLWYI